VSSGFDDTVSAGEASPVAPGIELAVGQDFAGRYDVEALIGRGGMGAVYRVRDRALGELVALKLLTLASKRAVERFRREVRLARRVTHPNVARIHDFGEVGEVRYLTMEYVEGRSLDEVLEEEGSLEPRRAAEIARDVAAGLEAAHGANVLHRDLKPANVLVATDGRVLLTDFGIASAIESDVKTRETGMLLGTPHYMSPEQVSGRPADARSDLYAFGLILFELLTGKLPFEGDTPIAIAAARLHQDPTDPRSLTPVPEPLAHLVLSCITRAADRRPDNMASVGRVLDAFLGRTGDEQSASLSQSLYAPIVSVEQTIAVLPFAYRGSSEHDYLGDALAEELVDVLSRTRGLRVLAIGATRRFADDRDPAAIAAELEVDCVVDGTVQLSGSRVRITARLIESGTAVQQWNDRFEGSVEVVLALQESMGRRIAEALRLEVDAVAHGRTAPREAIELYLRARRLLRKGMFVRAEDAIALLDRCIELAPGFAPGLVAHAIASVRAWWGIEFDVGNQRKERAMKSVALALERAPDLAETHVASAMIDSQMGRYREAAQSLAHALAIAPTLAEAQQYLGELQGEAGRLKEARERLELTLSLDPSLIICHAALARIAIMAGDDEGFARHARALEESEIYDAIPFLVARFRWSLYRADEAKTRATLESLERLDTPSSAQMVALGKIAIGEGDLQAVLARLVTIDEWMANPRFTALVLQLSTEVFCAANELDEAARALEIASHGVLVDIVWIDRCPVLEPLRGRPEFAAARDRVKKRAAEVWRR